MAKLNNNACTYGLVISSALIFLTFLTLTGLDEPDFDTSVLRYLDMFSFIPMSFYDIIDACKANNGKHLSYFECITNQRLLIIIKFVQYLLCSALILLTIKYMKFSRQDIDMYQISIVIFTSPAYLYYISNFTSEVIPYVTCILITFYRVPMRLIFVCITAFFDVGNSIVLFIFVCLSASQFRYFWLTSIFILLAAFREKILFLLFQYAEQSTKLYDVLNYNLYIVDQDPSLIPKFFITLASLMFLTPDKIGIVSTLIFLIMLMLFLIEKRKLNSMLKHVYVTPEFQTIALITALLPNHAYGKYFLFFIPMFYKELLIYLHSEKIVLLHVLFIVFISIELLWVAAL